MSTTYASLVPLIRAAVGDFGVRDANGDIITNKNDYAEDDIDTVITLALLKFPDFSGDDTNITPTVSEDADKGAIIFLSALYLALPNGPFSLEVPNMTYRKSANDNLIASLLGEYNAYINTGEKSAVWGTFEIFFNSAQLVADRVQESINVV